MANYSQELQNVIDNHGFKKENILYLPIAQVHLNRIKEGAKKVEFRDLTDFYLRKVAEFDGNGDYVNDKPLKAVLFQGGYNAKSPRLLVKLISFMERSPSEFPKCSIDLVREESYIEGFTDEDEFLAIILGEVLYYENFKG